jgi:DNA-binding MarR family transcriptional regulator
MINHIPIEQFADRMGVLMRRMAGVMLSVERNYLARGIITLPQLWVLRHIADMGVCPMHSISRSLGIKASTVTGLMDRLVKLGLAKRYTPESDRRGVLAEVTSKGRRILKQIHAERRRMLIETFGQLSAQERSDYLAIIEKVAAYVEARKKK